MTTMFKSLLVVIEIFARKNMYLDFRKRRQHYATILLVK
jgi:hypothetical protein